MIDESIEALKRLIEYAQREALDQGLRQVGYFLEMARESLEETTQSRSADGLRPPGSNAGDRGTGLQ